MENEFEPKAELRKQVERQVENPDWGKITALAKEKHAAFKGLISPEGAIHAALAELHPEFKLSATKISGTDVKGRLVNKTKPRVIDTKTVKNQAIRDVFVATEDMGVMKATLWGKTQVELFKDVEHGDAVTCKGVKTDTQDGESILRFYKNSEVEKLGDADVKPMTDLLGPVVLDDVKVSEVGVIKAVVVKAETVKFSLCPHCNGKLSEVEDTYICKAHNEVVPVTKEAVDITFDSGNGVTSTMIWPEMLGEGAQAPKQFDQVSLVCRAYDSNHFARERAKKESGAPQEVLDKQFPRDIRVTTYSFEVVKSEAPARSSPANDKEPVNVEDIEDAA